tara:strand:+ start:1489 stop:1731 length:243 start_codon:yes stop_codon:yes gene_type:complete
MNIRLEKEAERKQESRKIVKEIIDFGVTESQKFDIMFNISLTLENNEALKELVSILKKYKIDINNDEKSNYTKKSNQILT